MSNKNPFSDIFASFSSNGFNFDAATESARLNAEAFSEAVKIATEGAQKISLRQAEIAQQATEEVSKLFSQNTNSATKNPQDALKQQSELASECIKNAVNNSKEIFEIAQKTSDSAGKILTKRATDALNEATKATSKDKKTTKAA